MPYLHNEGLNLYGMMQEVRKALAESTASYWSDLEIYNKLNQAQRHIVTKSRCLKKTVTITTTESTQEYDLRDNSFSDIIDIENVYFYVNGSTYLPLTYKTKKQLDIESPGWRSVSDSIPKYYYYDKSSKTIGLYPTPNSSNAGDYLFVTGSHKPKVLHAGMASSGSTSTIVLPSGTSTVAYPNPVDDYYNNLYIEIYSGTGAGQKAEITDYASSTRTCSCVFATAPDNTSAYGMVPEIPEEAHYLMPLYALWKLWPKGGSRTSLGLVYKSEFMQGLAEFIGEYIEDPDEEIIKDSYR